MAFARDSETASAAQTDFSISFPYISEADVLVYVDSVLQTQGAANDYIFSDSTTVQFNAGLTGGEVVLRVRSTSQSARLVTYTAGELSEAELNSDSLQAFYMVQEAVDAAATALGLGTDDNWDAESLLIKNLGTPTAATDAVTKAYVDAISAAAGNVPTPGNPADDLKLLQANAGTFAWTPTLSAFMATVLDDATAGAARTTLGSTTVGDAVFIAASAAAARTAIGAGTASTLTLSSAELDRIKTASRLSLYNLTT